MSRTLNEVRLIGRLGKDPEMRQTAAGATVTTFTLATNRYTKAADGTGQEETDWHTIVLWDKLAETSNTYLRKGAQVFVGGRIQTRSWEQDGQKRFKTEIIANEMIMLDPKDRDGSSAPAAEALPAANGYNNGNGNGHTVAAGNGRGRRESLTIAAVDDEDGLPF